MLKPQRLQPPPAGCSQAVSGRRLYHHTSGADASCRMAAPPAVGVAVKRQRTQVMVDTPLAVAVAELGP